ncbi:MAG: SLC13 family permease [Blastocatellia bacterium]|nr:SLC13 family permease [Blastocatellia bacterium]
MTFEIALTFGILLAAVVLFVTEVVRLDLTALGVLVALALTGLVTSEQAIAGFSNPAVITVWAMYILSAGLAKTGVSSMIGNQLMRFAKGGDGKLTSVLMTVTALLSSFMNNIGVAAMFLPITTDLARATNRHASKLLLPMAYGSLLGGLILLIGTPSNLLVRDALVEAGLRPLEMFDFTIGGLVILAAAVTYMSLVGRRFLPTRNSNAQLPADNGSNGPDIRQLYSLAERLAYLVVPDESPLAGKTLGESRIGRALGLNVLSIRRRTGMRVPAEPDEEIRSGDRLLILGRLDRIEEIASAPVIELDEAAEVNSILFSGSISLAEIKLEKDSELIGNTVAQLAFRSSYGVNVLAICCGDNVEDIDVQDVDLQVGDQLLVQGSPEKISELNNTLPTKPVSEQDLTKYGLSGRILVIRVTDGSALAGRTLKESRLGAAFGLDALAIYYADGVWQMPESDQPLEPGDRLLVGGRRRNLEVVKGLESVSIDKKVDVKLEKLEVGSMRVVEVMLSPYTSLAGKTLAETRFREKYGLSVLAIWRGDRPYRTEIAEIELSFGDALLCYGPRDRFELLARDRDFVVLQAEVQEEPKAAKAPIASLIMVGVIAAVIFIQMPIAIAAITGCVLMVATRCLSMEQAYEAIDWKAVFLIAAMLPLGAALGTTGGASLLAGLVIDSVGSFGPTAVLAGLMIFSILITQTMPSAVVAVLMSPIALTAAANMEVSPYPFMMGIAYALAASFLSPVAHPANVLVMSPGGYRFSDYLFHGLPVSAIVIAISVLLLPILFPF